MDFRWQAYIASLATNNNLLVEVLSYYFETIQLHIKNFVSIKIALNFAKKMQKSEKKPSATYLLNELTKLKTQLKYLEVTQLTLKPVSHMPSELNELNELECLKIEQDLNLVTFEDKLKHDAFRLQDLVEEVRGEMLSDDGLCKFNTKQYRERIETIDQLQRELESKNAQQLKNLKSEYCSIENELLPLMNNLDLLQKTPTIKNKINAIYMRRAQSAPIDKNDCDDVRRFDRYLKEQNGHTGGWIEEEHLLFIKMKNKHNNNIEQICAAFKAFLIDKSEDEIRAHNEWHEKYLDLKMKKRQAILNWKRSRTPIRTMLQTA